MFITVSLHHTYLYGTILPFASPCLIIYYLVFTKSKHGNTFIICILWYHVVTMKQPCLKSTDAANVVTDSSLECDVSLAAPAVNIVHGENELNTSLASSSTSHVSSSEHHHVLTFSNPTSSDISLTTNSTGNYFKCT